MLTGQVLCMLGMSTYAVLLPLLQKQWGLSNAESGLIGSGFYLGYISTVTFWSTLTDRMDARRIYVLGCITACAGMALFGGVANGFWLALASHMLYGVGVSATYMPGLKILSDRYQGARQSRVFSFYTAFYGLGAALSLASTQWLSDTWGWRAAFLFAAVTPLLAMVLVVRWTRPMPADLARNGSGMRPSVSWRDVYPVQIWAEVFRQPRSRLFIIGYGMHCLEMFGSRAWLVAFLVFAGGAGVGMAAGLDVGSRLPFSAGAIAAVVSICSVGASILGNEAALRLGRARWIRWVMLASSLAGIVMALCAASPWYWLLLLVLLYSLTVMAESATLTAGLVEVSDPARRGAALGLYSLAGFAGGMLGPTVFGLALDATGGGRATLSWVAGFAALGSGCFVFALAQFWQARRRKGSA